MSRINHRAIYRNDEDRRLARILSILIWVSWGVYLFVIVTALYYDDMTLLITTLAGCALLFIPFTLLRRQYFHTSGLFVVLIELATVTVIATVGQGIRDLAVLTYPIILIFAGLALSQRFFRYSVGLTLVAVFWLVFGEFFGWFTTKPFIGDMTNWFYLIGVTLILLTAALAVNLLATNMRRNLELAKSEIAQRERVEEEIRSLNANLEQLVEARTSELNDAQEKLVRKEKLAVLGQMAGSVGHELRNPLGVINSSIYYLKLIQPEADEKIKKHLNLIEQGVQNSEKIISDLLDFSHLKSGNREAVSVAMVVRQSLERFPLPTSVDILLDLSKDLPDVFVDVSQMMQILGNLTTNACQAMSGVGKLLISSSKVLPGPNQDPQKEMVKISITDNGTGISPENIKKLFEPLFTTKANGIGLGLAVCQQLIEANGGRIEVESEIGDGCTFTVYLPVVSI